MKLQINTDFHKIKIILIIKDRSGVNLVVYTLDLKKEGLCPKI